MKLTILIEAIREIWKLKISDSAKYLLSLTIMAVGLGYAIWSETR